MCLILLRNHGAKDLLSNVHSTVQLLQLFQIDGLWCVGYWTYSETIVLKGRIFYSMKTINNGRKAIMEYPNLKLVITTLLQMNLCCEYGNGIYYAIQSIYPKYIIRNWNHEVIRHLILLRALVEHKRAHPIIANTTQKKKWYHQDQSYE